MYLRKGIRGTSLERCVPHPFTGSEAPPGGLAMRSSSGTSQILERSPKPHAKAATSCGGLCRDDCEVFDDLHFDERMK